MSLISFKVLKQSGLYFSPQKDILEDLFSNLQVYPATVVNLGRGVKTIRLTDFVKLPRGGGLLVIETYQQGPRSDKYNTNTKQIQ